MKYLRLLTSFTFIASLSGCAMHRELARDFSDSPAGESFEVKVRGNPRIIVRSDNDGARVCKDPGLYKNRLGRFAISGGRLKNKLAGTAVCSPNGKVLVVTFNGVIDPGEYRVEQSDGRNLIGPFRTVILFAPITALEEKFSSTDQYFQGAKALQDGANEGEISPANANRTDWWKIEVPQFAKYSLIFTDDTESGEVIVSLYRLYQGALNFAGNLNKDRPLKTGMEGTYFFKVQGKPYGRSAKYTLLVKSLEGAGGGSSGVGAMDARKDLPVADSWPISASKSAILVSVGSAGGLKVGDNLKVFDAQSSKLVDTCSIVSISETESECHMAKVISPEMRLKARRSL